MAVATGTATDYSDLLAKLNTFLTTTLGWTSKRYSAGSEGIWMAPGNADTDEIIVGVSLFSNSAADYYNWRLGGFTGYDAALAFAAQPGACTGPILPLWNQAIPYWFIGNARRVIIVAKVSTSYETAYLGFIDSYMSPGQYPYPLLVGGSMAFHSEPAATSTSWRWSSSADTHRSFPMSGYPDSPFYDDACQARLRKPDGTWRGFSTRQLGSYNAMLTGDIWPYGAGMTDWHPNLDGTYPLVPIVLHESVPNVYGELDGMRAITGHGNAAENTVPLDGDDYLVVQNGQRNQVQDYFAIKLA